MFYLVVGRNIDYPNVMEHEGHLYVAFAGGKQSVEVLKVKLSDVDATQMPSMPLIGPEKPATKTKKPLFDHVKLAAALATAHKKPYDGNALPFTTITWTKDHKNIRFGVDPSRHEWNPAA